METLTIKIKDSKALKLIYDLEDLNLIQVVSTNKTTAGKLSDLLKGSISAAEAEIMQKEVQQMRNEWARSTY